MFRKVTCLAVYVSILLSSGALPPRVVDAGQREYGPEVKSFLELMRHEDDELEFQIQHNEISRPHYIRAKARLAVQRQAVLDIVKETGEDVVPEIHVVTAAEIDQLIDDGARALKRVKRGEIVGGKWRYIGSSISSSLKGQIFYIFERLRKHL